MDDAQHHAISIDLPEHRYTPRIQNAQNPGALPALMASTTARIGVARAGPRYNTFALLLCQGDHAITQDALMRDVDQHVLDDLDLFTVHTKVTGGKPEYLLRPDLGRQLSDAAKHTMRAQCTPSPNIQLVVGDGLSAAAVEANVRAMLPALRQGAEAAARRRDQHTPTGAEDDAVSGQRCEVEVSDVVANVRGVSHFQS